MSIDNILNGIRSDIENNFDSYSNTPIEDSSKQPDFILEFDKDSKLNSVLQKDYSIEKKVGEFSTDL